MGQEEGRRRFGQLVRRYRAERGVSLAWVASMLSHPPHGQIWTGTGVRQLQNGERKLTPELVTQLIAMLDMDTDEAYEALGWWPPEISRRDLTEWRRHRDQMRDWESEGRPDRRRDGCQNPGSAMAAT